jgi:thiol-disulfide isomerase/thioredoxin
MVYKEIQDGGSLYNELRNNSLNVLKVYSNTCAPCKSLAPQYHELSQKYNSVNFLDVNMRTNLIRVNAVPTTIIIENGIIVEKILGGDIQEIESKLRKYL